VSSLPGVVIRRSDLRRAARIAGSVVEADAFPVRFFPVRFFPVRS
jgi:hypothetical protein